MNDRKIKIVINAQVNLGKVGGISQAVMGLIYALGRLESDSEEYIIVVKSFEQYEWLKPMLGINQKIVINENTSVRSGRIKVLKRIAKPFKNRVKKFIRNSVRNNWPEIPLSNGFLESLEGNVIHFPYQIYQLCSAPTVFNPHDLQHLHYPQFFTPLQLAWREKFFPMACHLSKIVVVASQWIKDDIIRQYRIDPEKIIIIPWGVPTEMYSTPSDELKKLVRNKYKLDEIFTLYPANTWPHKNHIRLLKAIANIRDNSQIIINLVCTGAEYKSHQIEIVKLLNDLNLTEQIKFLGFIPENELRALYSMAEFLVMPSLFESDSFPVYEAWKEGLPVITSNVTAMPDQVQDAALIFDPLNIRSIEKAILTVHSDKKLKERLIEKGYKRVLDFDWDRTARGYRAVYRLVTGIRLNDEDQCWLNWDWMKEPTRKMKFNEK